LHYFIAEDKLRFIKSLGCNVVRILLNYRYLTMPAEEGTLEPGRL